MIVQGISGKLKCPNCHMHYNDMKMMWSWFCFILKRYSQFKIWAWLKIVFFVEIRIFSIVHSTEQNYDIITVRHIGVECRCKQK